MKRILILLPLLFSLHVYAQDEQPEKEEPAKPATLSELAAEADLVAIAIVEQTEYQKTRDFPSSGWALMKILIPYKGGVKGQIFQVAEQGLGDDKCYYPETSPLDFEGQRFLVILKKVAQANYKGTAPACRIPVFVTASSGYAALYPIPGLDSEEIDGLAEQVDYADPSAFIDAHDFTFAQIDELEDYYKARKLEPKPYEPETDRYVYTQGIPITSIRKLLFKPESDQ